MTLDIITEGREKNVVGIRHGGRCDSVEYIESLDKKTRIKLLAVIQVMADIGVIRNTAKFRLLRDGIYEFKAGVARLFCFLHGDGVVCTHGRDKPKKKRLNIEIDKAKDMRRRFIDERGQI